MIPTENENPHGLHQKYEITKANGDPVDPLATYFVLRIDNNGDDPFHAECCRAAAREYCESIFRERLDHPLRRVADDLWELLDEIEARIV